MYVEPMRIYKYDVVWAFICCCRFVMNGTNTSVGFPIEIAPPGPNSAFTFHCYVCPAVGVTTSSLASTPRDSLGHVCRQQIFQTELVPG